MRTRSSNRWAPSVRGFATTTCSPICCGWSAAGWFTVQGQVVNAVRHTQAAGDWSEAARLLADHSFSLTLDGQAQTMQALLRAFPRGADHPELALVRAGSD